MKLSPEQLEEIEAFASLAFTREQVEVIMGFAVGSLEKCAAYDRGLMKSEAEVWQSIMEHAKAGSSPAQVLAVKRFEVAKSNKFFND